MQRADLTAEPHVPFPASGSYPLRAGNAVRPLVGVTPAFRRIGEAVEAARHSVWVTVAFLAPGFRMPEGRGAVAPAAVIPGCRPRARHDVSCPAP